MRDRHRQTHKSIFIQKKKTAPKKSNFIVFPAFPLESYPCHFDCCSTRHLCLEDVVCLSVKRVSPCVCLCVCTCVSMHSSKAMRFTSRQHLTSMTLTCTHAQAHMHARTQLVWLFQRCSHFFSWSDPEDFSLTTAIVSYSSLKLSTFSISRRTYSSFPGLKQSLSVSSSKLFPF